MLSTTLRRAGAAGRLRRAGFLLAGAMLVWGCGDDEAAPAVGTGAGLRLHLPHAAQNLPWMRIELWNDDVVRPPGCPDREAPGAGLFASALPAQTDSCTRSEIFIWDFAGRIVRHEPEVPFRGRAWGWDTRNNDGDPVPSGYYFTRQPCLDSDNPFRFIGHYYLRRDRERDRCEWPLWIEELTPGPAEATLGYAGFPVVSATDVLNPGGEKIAHAVFDNPFLVRIHAPGFEMFETEIRFTEFEYTDVDVTLTPIEGEEE